MATKVSSSPFDNPVLRRLAKKHYVDPKISSPHDQVEKYKQATNKLFLKGDSPTFVINLPADGYTDDVIAAMIACFNHQCCDFTFDSSKAEGKHEDYQKVQFIAQANERMRALTKDDKAQIVAALERMCVAAEAVQQKTKTALTSNKPNTQDPYQEAALGYLNLSPGGEGFEDCVFKMPGEADIIFDIATKEDGMTSAKKRSLAEALMACLQHSCPSVYFQLQPQAVDGMILITATKKNGDTALSEKEENAITTTLATIVQAAKTMPIPAIQMRG